jgi:hypothetical protein
MGGVKSPSSLKQPACSVGVSHTRHTARDRSVPRSVSADYQGLRRPTGPRWPDQSLRAYGDGRGRGHHRAGSRVGYAAWPEPALPLRRVFRAPRHRLLLGKALPPQAFTDDTVGRVLDRLYDFGTMKLFPSRRWSHEGIVPGFQTARISRSLEVQDPASN